MIEVLAQSLLNSLTREVGSTLAKEIGSTMKEVVPNFAKDLKPKTDNMETANLPIINEIDYLIKDDILAQRNQIKTESGYSDRILENIESREECKIYLEANLTEMDIDGNRCLVRKDIDFDYKDSMGRTNYERIEQGLSPLNKEGNVIELHHIGQHQDSPLAELTTQEHRGKGNDNILHDKDKMSEIDRNEFTKERNAHWSLRVKAEGESA